MKELLNMSEVIENRGNYPNFLGIHFLSSTENGNAEWKSPTP